MPAGHNDQANIEIGYTPGGVSGSGAKLSAFRKTGIDMSKNEGGSKKSEGQNSSEDSPETGRTRKTLFAHLRHELRTPINAIIGYAEMLLEDVRHQGLKDFVSDLESIQTAGNKLLGLVTDTLNPAISETALTDPALEALIARLSYDVRTPLNIIIGYSEMLLEDANDQQRELLSPDLRKIHSAAKSFLTLINDIPGISKMDTADDLGKSLAASDASVVVHDAKDAMSPMARYGHIGRTVDQGTLLVVDDNDMNRDFLSRHLERQGHSVEEAEDGDRALQMLEEQVFDLILLDIMMPNMNGFQVLEHLKRHDTWRHIPVIMISAVDEIDSVVRCIEMGAEDHLSKPFDPVILRARVSACLEKKRLRDLERLCAESMERELEIGQEIQSSFFPKDLPQLQGWEIAAHFQAAHQVGGDFYDTFLLSGAKSVGLVIADVCDKGVGAALFMGLFRSLIRAFVSMHYSTEWAASLEESQTAPEELCPIATQKGMDSPHAKALKNIISLTNNYIAQIHHDTNMFASLFFGVLEPSSGNLTYINGGHEPPAIIGPDGVKERLAPTGPAVGMMPNLSFETRVTKFDPGDLLVAFTDGVTEARSQDGDFFGEERMLELLVDPAASADTLVQRVAATIGEHTAGTVQSDDITLLVVRRV
ncbi:MAG: SpoIIE family protein phosphatase [Deltaproteobacteria bacterium]|nr:SpoIIE family protein phosphatase [Deltaproteobacteria bacterium]